MKNMKNNMKKMELFFQPNSRTFFIFNKANTKTLHAFWGKTERIITIYKKALNIN